MDVDPVGGDARLAGDPEVLDGDGALDGGHEVGVVEDDERCVAAQLEAEPLDLRGGAGHDRAAGRCGAGEGDLPDERVIEQLFLERPGRAGGDHVEGAGREPGIVGDAGDGERRQRRGRRRLQDDAAPGSQGRRDLAGDHRGREVPGRDRGDRPDGLAQHPRALAGVRRRHPLAGDAPGLLGKPPEVRDRASSNGLPFSVVMRRARTSRRFSINDWMFSSA